MENEEETLKHFSSSFQKVILASSSLKQIYNCPYMLLYIVKEQRVNFVWEVHEISEGSCPRVQGPGSYLRVQGSRCCLRIRSPELCLRIRVTGSCLRVWGPIVPVCLFDRQSTGRKTVYIFHSFFNLKNIEWSHRRKKSNE